MKEAAQQGAKTHNIPYTILCKQPLFVKKTALIPRIKRQKKGALLHSF